MLPSNRIQMYFMSIDWTIRHGYGFMRGTPVGRQRASGSSFSCRESMIFLASGSSSIVSPGLRFLGDTPPPPIHTPEKSGVPLASRGAGTEGFTAGFGAPGFTAGFGAAGVPAGFGAWAAAGAVRHRTAAQAVN